MPTGTTVEEGQRTSRGKKHTLGWERSDGKEHDSGPATHSYSGSRCHLNRALEVSRASSGPRCSVMTRSATYRREIRRRSPCGPADLAQATIASATVSGSSSVLKYLTSSPPS